MANQHELPTDVTLSAGGRPSDESLAEIGALFVEKELQQWVESTPTSLVTELGMRLVEMGRRSAGDRSMFRAVPRIQVESKLQMLARPFYSNRITQYHELWRVICTQDTATSQIANDWLVDLKTGHSMVVQTRTEFDGRGLTPLSGPNLALYPRETKLLEGAVYLEMLQNFDALAMEQNDDLSGFMRDTSCFVGGVSGPVDMTNLQTFRHHCISISG